MLTPSSHELRMPSIVIWTTTPWTIPGNQGNLRIRQKSNTDFIEVTEAADDNWANVGDKLILADKLASSVFKAARVEEGDIRENSRPSG